MQVRTSWGYSNFIWTDHKQNIMLFYFTRNWFHCNVWCYEWCVERVFGVQYPIGVASAVTSVLGRPDRLSIPIILYLNGAYNIRSGHKYLPDPSVNTIIPWLSAFPTPRTWSAWSGFFEHPTRNLEKPGNVNTYVWILCSLSYLIFVLNALKTK